MEKNSGVRGLKELKDGYHVLVNEFVPVSHGHLFNAPEFFKLHATNQSLYFQLVEESGEVAAATIHFTEIEAGSFRSPARGTFGGLSTVDDLPLDVIDDFLNAVDHHLTAMAAENVEILLRPAGHGQAPFAQQFNVFARMGYRVTGHELNYELLVNPAPLSDRMSYGNRKRLNKCVRAGFRTRLLGKEEYAAAYAVIADNRRRKGYPITMQYREIETMTALFDQRVVFHGVFAGSVLVAASVSLQLDDNVLYVFYWGDADDMQQYSPVVLLASEIYEYCRQQKLEILDVGTSTLNGVPNTGLVRFKRGLGFSESLKLRMGREGGRDA